MANLLCPACKKQPMEKSQDSETKLEVDNCPECLGIWFDAGELETFYKSRQLVQKFAPLGGDSVHHTYEVSTKARRCPRCRQGMDRPLVGGISVDVCRECRGIWFDHGELRKITEIHKTRGLKGDEEVTEQVRQGMRGGGNKGGGTLEVLNWFFNSFLGSKLR